MNNILITLPAKVTRKVAREFLEGYWQTAIIAYVIFYAILQIPVILYEMLLHRQQINVGQFIDIAEDMSIEFSGVSGLYQFALTAVFSLGFAIFFISLVRKNGPQINDSFKGFDYFFKSLGLFFMITLFVTLWALLLIIPGIIAALRYSQAFYILADNPDKGIMECINESKAMMMGNKWKLFCLDLSFIGWEILASLPSGIFLGAVDGYGIGVQIIELILSIPMLAPVVYVSTANACFYEMLKGKTYVTGSYDAEYEVVDEGEY